MIPMGNLTSQFFANVYLDALDQFAKHRLKAKYYLRYCDDFVLLSESRKVLEDYEIRIREFLRNTLHLELNERRRLGSVSGGIDFLGYIVRPDYLLVRRRVVGALRERLKQTEQTLLKAGMKTEGRAVFPWKHETVEELRQYLSSYLSHFGSASCWRLILSLRRCFVWLDEYFIWQENSIALRCPVPRHALRFSQQILWFRRHLPGHILVIQKGKFWEVLPCCAQSAALKLPPRFPERQTERLISVLLKSGFPAAWIGETGRRICSITERELIRRIP